MATKNWLAKLSLYQSQVQYKFVHTTVLEALLVGNSNIPCTEFAEKLISLKTVHPETDLSGIQEQFKVSVNLLWASLISATPRIMFPYTSNLLLYFVFCYCISLSLNRPPCLPHPMSHSFYLLLIHTLDTACT